MNYYVMGVRKLKENFLLWLDCYQVLSFYAVNNYVLLI